MAEIDDGSTGELREMIVGVTVKCGVGSRLIKLGKNGFEVNTGLLSSKELDKTILMEDCGAPDDTSGVGLSGVNKVVS